MPKDSITKDVHKIKNDYTKAKYMEYATCEGLKKEIEELYKKYEEKDMKTNRDYIIRQNRLSKDYSSGIKNIITSFIVGIASSIYVLVIDSNNIEFSKGILYTIILIIFLILCMWQKKQDVNKYANDIDEFEIDLIDKILKDKYNKSKGINNEEK